MKQTVKAGTIRVRHSRTNSIPPVVQIKTRVPGRWEPLKRFNYRLVYGAIPKGMRVAHRDGNTLNCDPENLVLITRRQTVELRRNKFQPINNCL